MSKVNLWLTDEREFFVFGGKRWIVVTLEEAQELFAKQPHRLKRLFGKLCVRDPKNVVA